MGCRMYRNVTGTFSHSDRTDLNAMYQMAVKGKSERDIMESFPSTYMRYQRGLQAVKAFVLPEREAPPTVHLLIGPPGTGKTRSVIESARDLWKSTPGEGLAWFDGYDCHKDVLLDEFSGKMSKCSLGKLLALIDRYVQRVPTKGSHTRWAPRRIYITTNYHPTAWYDWSEREPQWFALVRRFDFVIKFRIDLPPLLFKRGPGATPRSWSYDWRRFWGHPTQQLHLDSADKTVVVHRAITPRKPFDLRALYKGQQKQIRQGREILKKYLIKQ